MEPLSAFRAACAGVLLFCFSLSGAAPPAPIGDYETARSEDDEFTRLSLLAGGRATIVSEHNFQIPGDASMRRGRTTRFAKWTRKGSTITLTYAKVTDRLRYDAKTSLQSVGDSGVAPALTPVKPFNKDSRLQGRVLWRAPHNYKLAPNPVAAGKAKSD